MVITAERCIGKTTVIKKMRHEPAAGWVPVFQDLERCHSAAEFAMAVYKEIHQFLSKNGKATRRAKELFTALGGTEIGGVFKLPEKAATPWKDVLIKAVEDLIHENDVSGTKLLFLWDEMPFMLANIRDREGEKTAMEVLDVLRSLGASALSRAYPHLLWTRPKGGVPDSGSVGRPAGCVFRNRFAGDA